MRVAVERVILTNSTSLRVQLEPNEVVLMRTSTPQDVLADFRIQIASKRIEATHSSCC